MSLPARPAARLVLEDGTVLAGRAFGAFRSTEGEVVFATGMVGYPESLTDPSYRGQLLTLTYPLQGNYGVPERSGGERDLAPGFESERIHARALVVSTLSEEWSHPSGRRSLHEWLAAEGIPGIAGIDTRALTKRLRERGSMPGKLLIEGSDAIDERAPIADINALNLVAEVSVPEPIVYGDGKLRVALVDCGAKRNIVRSLLRRGLSVVRVPWDQDLAEVEADGILVSNGPGDPKRAERTIAHLRAALADGRRPVFGICLGNQLVALAAGADTYKLRFGHRGQNQPCIERGTRRCYITSQNHGYAVDHERLPEGWEPWFVNANDGTNEGIRHRSGRFFTVQFHPEATPGPEDTAFLFDRFAETLR